MVSHSVLRKLNILNWRVHFFGSVQSIHLLALKIYIIVDFDTYEIRFGFSILGKCV